MKIRKFRKKRSTAKYNLRQFKAPESSRVKPCFVRLQTLSDDLIKSCVKEEIKFPVEPGMDDLTDSIDELILSSSESYDNSSSIEILSSETEAPPPLRIWKIKTEIKTEPDPVISETFEEYHDELDCDKIEENFNFKLLHRIVSEDSTDCSEKLPDVTLKYFDSECQNSQSCDNIKS